jgi:predicted Ser/Thr protein kinase
MPIDEPVTEFRGPSDVLLTLGKYELREPIGSGASGTVFDAWDPDLARRVAIKQVMLLGRTEAEQQELRARFRQEARLASRLSHPGVVGVYDYGEQDGVAYLVMEFVDGETLAAMQRGMRQRQERMTPERAVAITQAMLLALAACHRAGVLHRDIKPGNIMLTRDGAVKLTDFGIARAETSDLTAQGTLLGTPGYMSPEQFEARASLDARSDLYSCGVVLYEMLIGRKPFEGDLFSLMHQVRSEPAVPPSRLVNGITPALDAVVSRAMAKRPDDRFATAEDFAQALRAGLYPLARPRSRAPALRVAATALIVVAVLGGAAWHFLALPDRRAGPETVVAIPGPARHGPGPGVADSVDGGASASRLPLAVDGRAAAPNSQAHLLAALPKLPCAAIGVAVQRDPPMLVLHGIVGEATANGQLAQLLAAYTGPIARSALRTFPESGGFCLVAELVRNAQPSSPLLALADGRTHLIAGDPINAVLQMPGFAGDVRLDYVTDGGRTVVHLDPAAGDVRHWDAGVRVALGPRGDGVIGQVGEPYGFDLLLVTVSARPLMPAAQAGQEPAEGYLRALQSAVATAIRDGVRVTADATVLETAAQ